MTERSFTVATDEGDLTVWAWGPDEATEVVLCLHGITAHGRSFRTVAESLPGHLVLAPDLRGRGASREVGPTYGMKAHADDCGAILRSVGVDDRTVIVVGHSMGGFVALVAAHRHRDLINRLVLVDGGLPLALPEVVLALPPEQLVGAVIGPALDRLAMTFSSRDEYRAMWKPHPAFADDWNPIIEAYVDEDLIGTEPALRPAAIAQAVLADGTSELTETDVEDALAALSHPTLLLAAEGGLVGPDPLYADDQLTDLDGIEVRRVAGVNHYTIVLGERGAQVVADAVAG